VYKIFIIKKTFASKSVTRKRLECHIILTNVW